MKTTSHSLSPVRTSTDVESNSETYMRFSMLTQWEKVVTWSLRYLRTKPGLTSDPYGILMSMFASPMKDVCVDIWYEFQIPMGIVIVYLLGGIQAFGHPSTSYT